MRFLCEGVGFYIGAWDPQLQSPHNDACGNLRVSGVRPQLGHPHKAWLVVVLVVVLLLVVVLVLVVRSRCVHTHVQSGE